MIITLLPQAGSYYGDFTICSPPQCRAFGRDLLEGKSKSQLFPDRGGGMHGAFIFVTLIAFYCIVIYNRQLAK